MCSTMCNITNIGELQGAINIASRQIFLQSLIYTLYLLSGNNTKNNVAIIDWTKNVEILHNNEGG